MKSVGLHSTRREEGRERRKQWNEREGKGCGKEKLLEVKENGHDYI